MNTVMIVRAHILLVVFCSACASVSAKEPAIDESDFQCLRPGRFPDASDCTKYHVCRRDLSLQTVTCGENGFDPVKQECSSVPCTGPPVDCTEHPDGVRIPFPKNRMFHVICLLGKPIFVDKCNDDEILNYSTQKCGLKRI